MKKKICFIINPISGIGRQKKVEKLIERKLNTDVFDYKIKYTQQPKDAILIAREEAKNNTDIVVAIGGDGSINEIAKGLFNSPSALGIIPSGSGNGLARHLGIPLNHEKALEIIINAKVKCIDTVSMNDELFVNVGGIGFDAHIGWLFKTFGKRGFSSYVKLVLGEFLSYKEQFYDITINGNEKFKKKAFLISFANGRQWGNNFYISPSSVDNDGFFELAILKNISIFNFIPLALKLIFRIIQNSSHYEVYKAKEAVILQTQTIAHTDGEAVEPGNTIALKIHPNSLNIIIP